jgi:hypothetical protein
MNDAERSHAGAPRPLTPTIIVLLVVGAVLLVIGLWTGGGGGPKARPAAHPDTLVIVAPSDSATVSAPLTVTFATRARLRAGPMGWQAGTYHLHALLDGADIMPGTLDVQPAGSGQFRWTLKNVAAGEHTLRLVWARPDHRSIPQGASQEISLTVQ